MAVQAAGADRVELCVLVGSEADELHFAAPRTIASGMAFRKPHVGWAGRRWSASFELTLTDPATVRRTIAPAPA